jgi:HAD superfamily 5'-nucleotidase-like hydrolase
MAPNNTLTLEAPERKSNTFSLEDYDAVGFDFDNTIFKYNLEHLNTLSYNCLAKCMIEDYGYDKAAFVGDEISADFIQRGLFVDTERGNFLKIGSNLEILRASHGTKMMSRKSIDEIYGKGATWSNAADFVKKSKHESYELMNLCFTDFIYAPIYLLCAQLVDFCDQKGITTYAFWKNILDILSTHYSVDNLGKSNFFEMLQKDFHKYSEEHGVAKVRDWLQALRKAGKRTFLLTAAPPTYSFLTNEKYLGKNWREVYDLACNGYKKPEVFAPDSRKVPFIKSNGNDATLEMIKPDYKAKCGDKLACGGQYTGGHYEELYEFLKKETEKEKPKVVYFGDDFLNDLVGAGGLAKNCHAVGVIDELAENYVGGGKFSAPTMFGKDSALWGSLFYDKDAQGRNVQTFWGQVLAKNTQMLVPSLECFADLPLYHKFRFPSIVNGVSKGSA